MGKNINKHIRVDEDHWKHIEKAAHEGVVEKVSVL